MRGLQQARLLVGLRVVGFGERGWGREFLAGVPLLVAAAFFTAREVRECGRAGLPLDDAWIYAALARDLAEGRPAEPVAPPQGPGARAHPLAAATSPLWCLVLAAGRIPLALGGGSGDPDGTTAAWLSKSLGLIVGWVACGLACRIATRISGSRSVGWTIATLLAVEPRFVRGVVSGFEVPLYSALALAAADAHLRWRDASGVRGGRSGILFALAGWARPECFLLLLLDRLVKGWFGAPGWRRGAALLKSAVVAALLFAPFGLLFLGLWGQPLPTSFAVKAGNAGLLTRAEGGIGQALEALGDSLSLEFAVWGGYLPALFLPLLPAFVLGARRLLAGESGKGAYLPVALAGFLILYAPVGPALPLQFCRRVFVLPLLYLLVVAAGLRPGSPPPRRGPRARWEAGIAGLLCLALGALLLAREHPSGVGYVLRFLYIGEGETYGPESASTIGAGTVRICGALALVHLGVGLGCWAIPLAPGRRTTLVLGGLAFLQLLAGWPRAAAMHAHQVRDTQELNVAAAQWVRDHLPPDARVAVHDLGAMAYFSRRSLLDLEGLGSPWAIAYRSRGKEGLLDLVRDARPSHYAGAPGGMGWRYALLGSGVSADLPPLFVRHWEPNLTVVSPTIVVLRLRWPEDAGRAR